MSSAVWEDLVVIRSSLVQEGGASKPHFEIDNVAVPPEELKAQLTRRQSAAQERHLALSISIQISNERMNQFNSSKDRTHADFPDVMAAMNAAPSLEQVVISPELDAFRAPWKPSH